MQLLSLSTPSTSQVLRCRTGHLQTQSEKGISCRAQAAGSTVWHIHVKVPHLEHTDLDACQPELLTCQPPQLHRTGAVICAPGSLQKLQAAELQECIVTRSSLCASHTAASLSRASRSSARPASPASGA